VNRILDAAGWPAQDRLFIEPGHSTIGPATFTGTALAELQSTAQTEQGVFFQHPDGTLRFYDRQHNIRDNWSKISQLTLGEGAEPYELGGTSIGMDDLDLFNEIQVTRDDGIAQRVLDTTSQLKYWPSSMNVTGRWRSDAEALAVAQWRLDRYKDAITRIRAIQIHPMADPGYLFPRVIQLTIGSRVTVTRTAPGGGEVFNAVAIIERIEHTITTPGDWFTVWALSYTDARRYATLDDVTYGVLDLTTRLFL
jgi:hypothetical protein